MRIHEIIESLDWRAHQRERYSHDDLISDVEAEIISDVKNAEKAKANTQTMKPKDPITNDNKAGPAGHYPNKSNPNAGGFSSPINASSE